jgi:hypothetical protein
MGSDWFGLACECNLDGELIRGNVRVLSHAGFVVETPAAFELGDEFNLRLVGGETNRPIYIRAVVESLVPPEVSGARSQPGVRFRLLRFSQNYGRLIAGSSSTEASHEPDLNRASSKRESSEREWLADILGTEDETPAKAQGPGSGEWNDYEPLLERAGEPLWAEDSLAPEAVVIDDGELDDVVRVLAELGVKTERQSPNTGSILPSWIPPQQLLIVSAKRALTLRLPLNSTSQGFVSIAVADSYARMTCSTLSRLGYQFAISRPIHPLAMSMLFRQAIFPDDDRRVARREVLCCSMRWWYGWQRKRSGLIVDVSPGGCQLLVRGAVSRGTQIKIRVPGAVAGGRGFTLAGKVLRSSPGNGGTTLGITFAPLSAKLQGRLQQVLALPAPSRMTEETMFSEDDVVPADSVKTTGDGPLRDRRQNWRVAMHQEVVALEQGSGRVTHVLVSSDLTVDGMQVEAHPSLVIDEQLDLAFFGGTEGIPLIVSAVVARDDGRSGWWLRFVGATPEVHLQLVEALDRFPPITRLDESEPESGRVVLGQVGIQHEELEEDELA